VSVGPLIQENFFVVPRPRPRHEQRVYRVERDPGHNLENLDGRSGTAMGAPILAGVGEEAQKARLPWPRGLHEDVATGSLLIHCQEDGRDLALKIVLRSSDTGGVIVHPYYGDVPIHAYPVGQGVLERAGVPLDQGTAGGLTREIAGQRQRLVLPQVLRPEELAGQVAELHIIEVEESEPTHPLARQPVPHLVGPGQGSLVSARHAPEAVVQRLPALLPGLGEVAC
jgi:hypothetical protein